MVVWSLDVVCFDFCVFVQKAIHRGHGSHDRLVRSFVPAAFCYFPPKPRRFRILNGLLYFFPEYMEIFPFDRTPLFNPNLRTQSGDAALKSRGNFCFFMVVEVEGLAVL
jgi:hypothetical protein